MSRWIRLNADIFEHGLFAGSVMSEREAWIWLIARAAWKDARHRVGGNVVPVPVGSLFVTLREMQLAWGWKSDYRVRSFLKVLENERMISTKTNAGKTHISICNYDKYQNVQRAENAQKTHEQRTENAIKTPIHQYTMKEDTSDEVSKKRRGSRLSEDWTPSQADIEFAHQHGLNSQSIQREADSFRDYWTSKPGASAVKLDWAATWRNWIRSAKGRPPRDPPKPSKTAYQQHQTAVDKALDEYLGIRNERDTEDNIIDLGATDYRRARAASSCR